MLATLEFQNYALLWWNKLVKETRRYSEPSISTWEELKALMKRDMCLLIIIGSFSLSSKI